jgi:hypothetical protein
MRKLLYTQIVTALFFAPILADDFTGEDMSFIEDVPNAPPPQVPTWRIEAMGNITGSAKFTTPEVSNQSMTYAEAEIVARYLFADDLDLIYSVGIGYNYNLFHWPDSPVLNHTDTTFNTGIVNVGVLAHTDDAWTWQAEIDAYLDMDKLNQDNAHLLIFGGWGRYTCGPCWGTSIGFIARTGIRQDRVWPILGLDFHWGNWDLNMIYPVNMSLVYHITCNWSASIVGRLINVRHRLPEDEPLALANGILEYRNFGTEFAINYDIAPVFSANIHAGVMSRGDLLLSNNKNEDTTHYKSDSVGYLGAGLKLIF